MVKHASTPFTIWEHSGITEHMGGIAATRRLIEACQMTPGQLVLNLGCGTGYTACMLAEERQTGVVGVDLNPKLLATARVRAQKMRVSRSIPLMQADVHELPFAARTFDRVLVESVLVFCEACKVAAEIYRVLKPGGLFGANELTLLKQPPAELLDLLNSSLGMRMFDERGWQDLFKQAGFSAVTASVHRVKLGEQLASHMKIDGLPGYLAAVIRGLSDPTLYRMFINAKMLRAAKQFMPYVGYGLYQCTK